MLEQGKFSQVTETMNTTTTQSTVINLSSRTLTHTHIHTPFKRRWPYERYYKNGNSKKIQKGKKSKKENIASPFVAIMKILRSDSLIVIERADKGNSTVIMNRKDYDTKILSMLNGGP
jgi:hypothetical protein